MGDGLDGGSECGWRRGGPPRFCAPDRVGAGRGARRGTRVHSGAGAWCSPPPLIRDKMGAGCVEYQAPARRAAVPMECGGGDAPAHRGEARDGAARPAKRESRAAAAARKGEAEVGDRAQNEEAAAGSSRAASETPNTHGESLIAADEVRFFSRRSGREDRFRNFSSALLLAGTFSLPPCPECASCPGGVFSGGACFLARCQDGGPPGGRPGSKRRSRRRSPAPAGSPRGSVTAPWRRSRVWHP